MTVADDLTGRRHRVPGAALLMPGRQAAAPGPRSGDPRQRKRQSALLSPPLSPPLSPLSLNDLSNDLAPAAFLIDHFSTVSASARQPVSIERKKSVVDVKDIFFSFFFFFPLWNLFFSFFPLLFILSFHLISRWHFIVANDQMNPVSMSGASVVGVEGFPPPIPSPPPPLCTPLITIISTIQSKRNHRSFEFIFRI